MDSFQEFSGMLVLPFLITGSIIYCVWASVSYCVEYYPKRPRLWQYPGLLIASALLAAAVYTLITGVVFWIKVLIRS
jgi:hypothetical protein